MRGRRLDSRWSRDALALLFSATTLARAAETVRLAWSRGEGADGCHRRSRARHARAVATRLRSVRRRRRARRSRATPSRLRADFAPSSSCARRDGAVLGRRAIETAGEELQRARSGGDARRRTRPSIRTPRLTTTSPRRAFRIDGPACAERCSRPSAPPPAPLRPASAAAALPCPACPARTHARSGSARGVVGAARTPAARRARRRARRRLPRAPSGSSWGCGWLPSVELERRAPRGRDHVGQGRLLRTRSRNATRLVALRRARGGCNDCRRARPRAREPRAIIRTWPSAAGPRLVWPTRSTGSLQAGRSGPRPAVSPAISRSKATTTRGFQASGRRRRGASWGWVWGG